MNILLVAASFSPQLSGVQRHAFNVARSLLSRREISAVHLVVAPWQRELAGSSALGSDPRLTVHIARMSSGAISRNRWYYRQLPLLAAELGADVVHLAYPVPVNSRAFACPIAVTLHDLYPYEVPANFGFPKAIFNQLILQQCLRNVNSIVCVSEVTRESLRRYVPQRVMRKSLRIYNCVEPARQAAASPVPALIGKPFLLCVAQHRRNKNISFLLRVFRRLMRGGQAHAAMRLVIVGISGPESDRIRRTIERSEFKQNILLMEGLSEAELQWCYRNCAAVVAPSTVEGFGLPVAEALLAGCHVICSDLPVFRELGGRFCRYVPLDFRAEEAFAEAILSTLPEQPRQAVSLPNLSIPVIAEQYVRLYRGLLGQVASEAEFPVPGQSSHAHAAAERQSI